ncbi:hypothetical protein [Flavobacterium sp. GSA192]|uniref:hypothetical protein n=1 Tax=Flavobacterium sp. GSA192 TaxID=2576304 RepID=UPI0011277CAE|nr:hypothetical protein [Flavobacterium sp. GSA192]
MNLILEKNKGLIGFCILFAVIVFSCADANKEGKQFHYRSINDKDTAFLNFIKLEDNRFFGQYEIRYGGVSKDSGEIRGIISGDTIKGSFYYQPYGGGVLKRYPIALLKRKNKLLLGKGVISVYMGIPSFLKGDTIDYSNPEFVFEEIKKIK